MKNKKDIQKLVKSMYEKGQIELIQERSAKCYALIISHGFSHLEAIEEILSHGVEYNDIMSGILTKGIEG